MAVVGCGYWGANHIRVLDELPDADVVLACDQRRSRLDEIVRRFRGLTVTTDAADVFAHDAVEAVVVATQAETHYDLASRALAAGKHVLVEKPLTTNVRDADDLIRVAERVGRTLMVGHTFLYNTAVRKVREYVGRGALGSVYYLYARRTSLGPIRTDVNAIWDLASHDVSIFNYLLRCPPAWVSAVGADFLGHGRQDVGFISLGYPHEIVAHIHVSWADPAKVREVAVVGSDARVVFNDLDPLERVRLFNKGVKPVVTPDVVGFGEHHFQLRDGDITSPVLPVIEPLRHEIGHFLHCIRRGEVALSGGRQGRDVVCVLEAIDRSMRANGAPVSTGAVGPYLAEKFHAAAAR